MRALAKEDEGFEVPLTPLIDIVFLLLIFFLVATNFTRKEYDQRVELPSATGGQKQEFIKGDLVVNIRDNGNLIISGRMVKEQNLPAIIQDWKKNNKKVRVLLRGDGKVSYKNVMRVMGICREQGVTSVDLPVESE